MRRTFHVQNATRDPHTSKERVAEATTAGAGCEYLAQLDGRGAGEGAAATMRGGRDSVWHAFFLYCAPVYVLTSQH